MKKKFVAFCIYAFVIITVLAVIIVLRFNTNNNSSTPKQSTSGNATTNETSTKITMTLNTSKNITMSVGDKVELLSGYLSVDPEDEKQNLIVTVEGKYSSPDYGVEINNNLIEAKIAGYYNLTFSIASAKEVSLSIHVVENQPLVKQINSHLTQNIEYSLSDLFEFDALADNYQMSVNGFNVQNNLYSINSTGVNAVELYFVRDYVKFHYTFNFNVSKTPEYSIIFTDATPRDKVTIEDNKLTIIDEEDLIVSVYYEIFDKNNESSTQSINVDLSTENIVQIDSAVGGRIRLSVLNKGECSIIISVSSDPNTVLELSIEVK